MVALIKYALACTSFTAFVMAVPLTLVKREISGVQTQCKKGSFALTFDDGPYKYTEELVDILNENQVKVGKCIQFVFLIVINKLKLMFNRRPSLSMATISGM